MRIALITENFLPKLDGVTRTLAALLDHLRLRGHEAIVFGPEGAPRRYAGARVVPVAGVPLPFYPELRALIPMPRLERSIARFRPDIIHVAEPMLLGAAGIAWAQRLDVPVIASYHTNLAEYCRYFHLGALSPTVWAYRRFLHNACAATLCPSPSTARQLRLQGFERVRLWRRGVDAALFSPERRSRAWRERMAGDPDLPIALYVGRLSHEKNLNTLVSAWTARRRKDARLVLVGDGPARADLEAALADQPVTFTGYLRGEALAEAYASSDVFAFPSLTETFGQAVQEAMASGLPVLGFDADGVRDLVRPDVTGRIAPANDTATFTALLDDLLDAPDERARLGARACAIAQTRTWESVMDSLLSDYEQVIADYESEFAA